MDNDLNSLDFSSVSCYLKCPTTLMEVAIALGLKHLPEEREFKPVHNILKRFTEKTFWEHFKAHRDVRETDLEVSFLAEYAHHLLAVIGSDTSKKYRALRYVFFAMRGIATIAASASIDLPWAALKGIIESADDFKKALDFHDRKLKAFIYLNLLQAAYLGAGPQCLADFNQFSDELLHAPAQVYTHLHMHNRRFFVLGFLELLQMIHQTYADEDPEVGKKAIDLITLVKNNNSTTSNPHFRVRPKEATSNLRDFIAKQADQILERIDRSQRAKGSSSIQNTNRLFPLVHNQNYFWLEILRKQLQGMDNDKQLKEDEPYIVELKGISRGHTEKLEDHLRGVLHNWNLVLITAL